MLCTIVLLQGVALSVGAAPLTQEDFAQSLMKSKDYYRAISCYKELAFFNPDTSLKINYMLQISKAYRLSHRYDLSIDSYTKVLQNFSLSDSLKTATYMGIGVTYLAMPSAPEAYSFLTQAMAADSSGFAQYHMALYYSLIGDWATASSDYHKAALRLNNDTCKKIADTLSMMVLAGKNIATRNPLLAMGLSAVVPGTGQLYGGHAVDALQAFFFTSAFIVAGIAAYKWESHGKNPRIMTSVSVSFASLFYCANIYGASKTALYYNKQHKDMFYDTIRTKHFLIDAQ